MIRRLFTSASVLAALTLAAALPLAGAARAQSTGADATNSPSQNQSTNGPAGTYDKTTTQTTVAPDGVQSQNSESFDKTQSYTSGPASDAGGSLTAHTHIDTSGPTTTTTSH